MDQSQSGFDHVGLYPSCYFYRANERISAPADHTNFRLLSARLAASRGSLLRPPDQ